MATKITLELDDRTEPGFDDFESNAERAFGNAEDAVDQVIDRLDDLADSQEQIAEGQQQISRETVSAASNTADQLGKAGAAAAQFGGRVAGAFAATEEQGRAVQTAVGGIGQSFQALTQVHSVIDGISRAKQFWTTATAAQTAANQGLTASNAAAATSTGLVTTAVNALRAALLANPITAILVGIGAAAGAVAAAYMFFRDSKDDVGDHTRALEANERQLDRLREGIRAVQQAQEQWAAAMLSVEEFDRRAEIQREINEIQKLGLREATAAIEENHQAFVDATSERIELEQQLNSARGRLVELEEEHKNLTEEDAELFRQVIQARNEVNRLIQEQVGLEQEVEQSRAALRASQQQELRAEEELQRIREQEVARARDAALQQVNDLDRIQSALEQQRQIRQELIDQGDVMGDAFRHAEAEIQRLSRREQQVMAEREAERQQFESARLSFENTLISHEQQRQDEINRTQLQQEDNLDNLRRAQSNLRREYQRVREEVERVVRFEDDHEKAAERINDLKDELVGIKDREAQVSQRLLNVERERERIEVQRQQREQDALQRAMMEQMGGMAPLAQQFIGQVDPREVGMRAAEREIEERGLRQAAEAGETPAERQRARRQMQQITRQMIRQAREGTMDRQQFIDTTNEIAQEMVQQAQQQGQLNQQTAQAMQQALDATANHATEIQQVQSAVRQMQQQLQTMSNNSRRRAQQGGLR